MAKRLGLQKFLFVILLMSFALGEIARIQFSNGIAIKALDIAVFLFVVLQIFYFRRPLLARPILIFVSVAALSLLINSVNLKTNEMLVSSLYLIRWIAYAGVYFIVSNFDRDFKKNASRFLVVVGGVVLSLGFVQYFLYPNLRNLYYLGWDEHLYRLFSTFLDPNFAGAFFVLYFLFLLGLFFKRKNILHGLLAIVTLLAIALTFSRSAYLMLFVGLFTFMILWGKKRLFLIFTIVFVSIVSVLSMVGFKSEGTNLLRLTSSQARIPSAKSALAIFEKNPIFGVGFNAYQFAIKKYNITRSESKYPDHSASGTDNSFLFVLATTGIVGLFAYLYLWTRIISFAKFRKKMFSAVIISSSVSLLVGSLFANSLFYAPITLWMWILLGLSEG